MFGLSTLQTYVTGALGALVLLLIVTVSIEGWIISNQSDTINEQKVTIAIKLANEKVLGDAIVDQNNKVNQIGIDYKNRLKEYDRSSAKAVKEQVDKATKGIKGDSCEDIKSMLTNISNMEL